MELIAKNNLATAEYDPELKIVHYKFVGKVNIKLATELLDEVLKFAKTHQVLGVHCDISKLNGTFTMMNDYLVNTYFPPLISQGLICNSMIVSNDVFTTFATNQLIQRMGDFTIKNFNDIDEGYNWVVENVKKV